MSLENRLNRLELKMKSSLSVMAVPYNTDDCITKMGLEPAAVREVARRAGISLAGIVSEMLGVEPREFVRLLKEKANLAR